MMLQALVLEKDDDLNKLTKGVALAGRIRTKVISSGLLISSRQPWHSFLLLLLLL
jgi:hypothetical protein